MNAVPRYRVIDLHEKKHDVVVYIFYYNEGKNLERLLDQFAGVEHRTYDIMVGDDGSADGVITRRLLRKFGVRGCTRLPRNMGLSHNIKATLHWLKTQSYSGVIFINGNNRDNPAAIPLFCRELKKGYGYIQGSRFIRGGKEVNTPIMRKLAIRFVHAPLFSLASGKWMTDTTNGFFALSSTFLNDPRMDPFQEKIRHYDIERYLGWKAIRLGYPAKEIPVERKYSDSKFTSHIKPGIGWIRMFKPLVMILFNRFK